ncbi:MAG: WYL domain-containing protein [Geobacteraceae bacterium]|nr:WYL domain-containing protein [Geobacteraceae bacterium]
MNKLHVAVRLLQLLNEKRSITTRIVADDLQVHVRTAQRYLNDISVLPCVVCDEEKHTYSLSPGYVINDSILNTQEISLLYVLLDYAAHVLGPDRAAIPAKVKQKLAQVNEVYHVIQEDGMEIASLVAIRLALESAIRERKMVSFTYTRYDADYTVEPYRVVHAGGFWYLVAGHEGKLKKFLLDFIDVVTETDQYFPAPPAALAAKLTTARTIWFDEGDPVKVTLEIDEEVAHFFRRKQFFPAQEIKEDKADGSIIVTLEVANEMDFFQQVARWLPYFRVIEPPEYREFICEQARQALELNT